MPFHDVYQVKAGDNLTRIAAAYGFDNPGPIWAYPPNRQLFLGRSPNLIRPNERIHIPYHPDLLRKIVATSRLLIAETTQDATRLINQGVADKRQLEEFLFKVDAVNFLANIGVGIGSLAATGLKGGEMTGKEALLWLAESRAGIAGNIATATIPAPDAPKRDFKFWVRHALGPWNPSFWASVYAAIGEGNVDLYLYGADATAYQQKLRVKRQAEADIAKLQTRITEAQQQLAQAFYKQRI